jgi:hypothetical protein
MRAAIIALIAILIVGGLVGGGLYWTRNNKLQLNGQVLGVRSFAPEPNQTITVIDFRVTNPSPDQFVVKDVDVYLDTKDGKTVDAANFGDADAQRVFDYYKVLGKKYNQTLLTREKINPGQTVDRMIAVRFDVSDQDVTNRKAVRVLISDIDGQAKSEITEARK